MLKHLKTNTRIAPIVDVSTYDCGPFSYESLWMGDAEAEREEGRFVCDDYSHERIGERLVQVANRVFNKHKPLEKYGVVRIKATGFGSPAYYNFETDWLDLTVSVDSQFFTLARQAILKKSNRKAIVKYAGDNWVSYDGFMSSMLDRLQELSRDTWKARYYGAHMATDAEVEAALVADICDAFDNLKDGVRSNECQDAGAILALLWLIEYPNDRDSGFGWVSDEMYEYIRGNSSLSEFCTVLTQEEVYKEVGESLIDFDGFMLTADAQYKKYVESGVGEDSKSRAKAWLETVRKDVQDWESRQAAIISNGAPKWDDVKKGIAGLKEEWEEKLNIGWPGAWK